MNGALVPFPFRDRPWRLLAPLALGLALSLPCRGDQTPASMPTPQMSEPPSSPPPPPPPPPSDSYDYSSSYTPNDFYSSNPFPSDSGFNNFSSPYIPRRIPVFFPPTPPQIGLALDSTDPLPGRLAAPPELAAYVNEAFYAPLSTRLVEKDLRGKLRTRLDEYRATKTALQGELRAKLDALANADPFTRQRELVAFARLQTPRIAALELTAEQLRPDLIAGTFFQDNADWNESRRWQLGASGFKTSLDAMRAQCQVMRAAIFYQKGLSPAQRRLLREIAIELDEVADRIANTGDATPPNLEASADTNPLFFFSPETARFRLPVDLPVELTRKISAYESAKSELKAELRKAIYDQDNAHFAFLRTRALESLAQKQQPRLAALEVMAEDIRRDLALLPNVAAPPPLPAVPSAIVARMMALVEKKKNEQKSVVVLIQEIKKIISVARIDGSRNPDGRVKLSIVISPRDRTEEKIRPVRELVSKYNEQNEVVLQSLEKERVLIHDEMVQFVGPGTEDVEKNVRNLLDESYSALERQSEWALYKDYRTAVLEPGLSPEQRRLLYDGGLEMLELPLPGAERMVASLR